MILKCVNIATTNVSEMKEFYSFVLDAPYVKTDDSRYEIFTDNVCIVIQGVKTEVNVNPEACGLEFEVENVDSEYERIVAGGIKTGNAPATLPWNYRFFAIKDPDGNNIDFVQFIAETNQSIEK